MTETVVFCPNWIGDVILSTPAIRLLRKLEPDSRIVCIVPSWCRDAIEGNPDVAEVIVHQEHPRARLADHLRLLRSLRNRRINRALLFHRSFTRALILKLSGAGGISGYPSKHRGSLLDHCVEEPAGEVHRAVYFLRIVISSLGAEEEYPDNMVLEEAEKGCEFHVSPDDTETARQLLENAGARRYAALCPGGNWAPKRWPVERFADLCAQMWNRMKLVPVLCGAGGDSDLCSRIEGASGVKVVNLCGRTSLRQFGAVAASASVVVTNDSAPMHIAASVGAPLVSLFGPTSAGITGALHNKKGLTIMKNTCRHAPCYEKECDGGCMDGISVEDVMRDVEKVMSR